MASWSLANATEVVQSYIFIKLFDIRTNEMELFANDRVKRLFTILIKTENQPY